MLIINMAIITFVAVTLLVSLVPLAHPSSDIIDTTNS